MVDHHEGLQDQEKIVANIYESEHNPNSFVCQEEYTKGVIPIPPGHTSMESSDTARSFTHVPSGSSSLYKEAQVDESHSSPPGASNIAILHNRDDVDISTGWRRWVFALAPLFTMINTVVYLFYLGLRIYCIVMAQRSVDIYYGGAWVFVAIEMAVAIPSLIHNCWTIMAWKKRSRPKLRLTGEKVPSVDVFVTCCGEDDAVVLDTIRGALDQDYPLDKFRVVVLDDARSASLASAVGELATMHPNIFYMAREKIPGKPHHFKAGNLNYGLEQVEYLPGGASELIAALDADMIPEREWLRACIPHLLVDPKVALSCPPQLFYNTPASDPLGQSLDFFVHIIEPIKDALGVAWCTGSGYVVRRQALADIGNFPLGTLTEDVATSTLMLGKGWKTVYIHEPLQFGSVPEDYGGHLKQRTRWAIGTVDTAAKLNFCLWGESVRHLTFAQRFSGFIYAILNLFTLLLTASLFTIPIILLWGKPLVAYANDDQLHWLIWACFISTVVNRLCEATLFSPAGYHTGQRNSRFQLWMAPYIAVCMIRSFILPKWLGGQTQAFKPTGSLASALNERDPKLTKNMFVRLRVMLLNYMVSFHLAFVYVTLVAVIISSYRCFAIEDSAKDIIICLITHAFWPPFAFFFICSSMWTPIAYAINPPIMPDREELLVRDQKTGVAHPTEESKRIAFGGQAVWFEFEYSAATIATVLVFAYSFFF
ncbi:nucleotide-diphospho-sugar transferase [Aspergillus pseudonomiae]|uniref:Nucleotide-diphospho-sugar transferase n=1 Tax=Aspergillus pseudonomiae TaxID=1506151 RepID=A0A5N7DHF7_9EURO|nr:nucleotide-diphospho-sugar transferase [Aspergillus pseudonomiae]KAE8405872.1 nucleotide-diphospho-sugar transferase [Aspergillus pseudonomiae]